MCWQSKLSVASISIEVLVTGDKPFKCNECEYRTGDHNSLRRHNMRHTGEKPYKCSMCSYSSIQSAAFKRHVKSKHSESQMEIFGITDSAD